MDSAKMHPKKKAICPLFNFQIPEVSIGGHHEEAMEYLKMLREKFEEGIEVLDDVRIRRIRKEDLEGIKKWGMVHYYSDIFSRINTSTFVIEVLAEQIEKIDFDKRKSFRIACERFNRAYEEHREDEILIDFMIAFEALFLRGERAPSEKGQFIGLGCSILLGNNEKEREEINNFLIKAYNMRNRIVHGSEYKTPIQINNEDYGMRDFILKLQQYLSESIRKLID